MSEQQQENPTRRFGADGEETAPPTEPTDEVIVANVPGDDESKFVTLRLSHPLNERDRQYLGLPLDASTEVNQQVRVNRNGAKALINAGLVQVDPEDSVKVRSVLRGESPEGASGDSGEPTSMRTAEVRDNPLDNPPQAATTPVTPGPNAPQPGQAEGDTDGSQPSAEGDATAPAKGDATAPAKGVKGR